MIYERFMSDSQVVTFFLCLSLLSGVQLLKSFLLQNRFMAHLVHLQPC